jgi:hypothetical protein
VERLDRGATSESAEAAGFVEKEGPEEEGVNWLEKGYPYAPGKKRPKEGDPMVEKGLKSLREKGASQRIVESVAKTFLYKALEDGEMGWID